ncbi:ribonuclease P protein subunit [Candidatus Micrarchaeota archaeon]|nr:ribonuclease P protein subunit [Candidatus Micrarchaeota archaeon]
MGRKLPKEEYGFLLEELIGQNLKIKRASSKDLQGIEGRVIDESKNSFLLETSKGKKRIPKKGSTFVFESHHEAKGNLLLIRPEDRTKKLAKEIS